MKILFLDRDDEVEAAKVAGQFADRSHTTLTIDTDTKVITPDGIITAALLSDAVPAELHKRAYELWKAVNDGVENRPTAVGTLWLPRSNKKDSVLSSRSGVHARVLDVVEARQDTLGYSGQTCRETRLTIRHPEMLLGNRQLVRLVDHLYAQHLPTFYASQRAAVAKVPHCRLWNTAFTTIYIAKNFRTAYHVDTGNLRGVMSALLPLGDFVGGELVFPRWRLAIAFEPGDLLLFDPQQLHGNLPFEGERLSAAFYCDRRIADCGR